MNLTRQQEEKLIEIGLEVVLKEALFSKKEQQFNPSEPKKTRKRKSGSRKWTAKQRRDAAKRMQAFWKKKNGKK